VNFDFRQKAKNSFVADHTTEFLLTIKDPKQAGEQVSGIKSYTIQIIRVKPYNTGSTVLSYSQTYPKYTWSSTTDIKMIDLMNI